MDLGISQVSASLAAILLGSLTLLCVFKTPLNGGGNPGKESLKPASSGSESRYAVETINVTKRYSLGPHVVLAINGINLKVRKGEFVAIMGPSGSGKSTLLNLIGALDRPSSGKVLIDGVDISKLDEGELAKLRNEKIGFIFQAYNLISRSTVLRNMELPALVKGYSREERLRRIRELLAVVGLEDKIMRKPKTLSGGEQQRVAIARALMNDPQIVLADEPTGNVDSKTGKVIMKFLRKLNLEKGTTVIVVTHDPEVARMADRILYLRDGRIVKEEVVGGASAWKEELKAVSS
ncbi:ABC transporter ATP-binding protein [Candidatus Bathyarchaeota archaeon]|nr:MAG: ABC transporter ATP-binding protein [Candidatus Bathyarchaeota archaeon]